MKYKYILLPLCIPTLVGITSCSCNNNDTKLVPVITDYLKIEDKVLQGFNDKATEDNLKDFNALSIPKDVQKVGNLAFADITDAQKKVLATITFEEGCVCSEIGETAFQNNEYITKVILPPKLSNIGSMVFAGCSGLKEIDLTNVEGTITYDKLTEFNKCDNPTKGTIYYKKESLTQGLFATALVDPKNQTGLSNWTLEAK